MRYGIRDGCLNEPWEKLFAVAHRLGFDGVELDIGGDFRQSMWWTADGMARLRSAIQQSGAELASVCLGAYWSISPASRDPQVRAAARELAIGSLRRCRDLGARWILAPITPAQDVPHEEARQRWIEEMRACAPVAEETEVYLALENVGAGSAQSASDLLAIVEGIGSPYVKAYYDPGNGLSLGNDPVAEILLLGAERIVEIHAKDPGGELLGEGKLDWDAVAAAIKQIGYSGYVVLETPRTSDPERAARHNLAFLRERLG